MRAAARIATTSVIVMAATYAPFAIANPRAFWYSAIEFHMRQPSRPDALNLTSFLAVTEHVHLPGWSPVHLVAVTLALCGWRLRPPPSRFTLATAAVLFVLFATARAALANYHLAAGVAGCWAAALSGQSPGGADGRRSES